MSTALDVTSHFSKAGVAVRQCLPLPADPDLALSGSAVLLRAAPSAVEWLSGWVAAEFPTPVLTGAALSRMSAGPVHRFADNLSGQRAGSVLDNALQQGFGAGYSDDVYHPVPSRATGGFGSMLQIARKRKRYTDGTAGIAYGPHGSANLLDIWRSPDLPTDHPAPVLIQVPGGCWALNDRRGQAYPLMCRMVELGWICVSINYRRSPANPWPAHIIDVKRAIAWVREHIAEYGGEPDFIAITGGSAGGQLSALAALTPNDPRWQPGFENADTSVEAAVPAYGIYDLARTDRLHKLLQPFLECFVLQTRYRDNPALFEAASPIYRVHRDAPPFFVLSGACDAMVPRVQAQAFCAALRQVGAATVAHAELPNASHAFDLLATVRCQLVAQAVADFLGIVYGRHLEAAACDRRPVSLCG
jgi:acetyl esterase/lipase